MPNTPISLSAGAKISSRAVEILQEDTDRLIKSRNTVRELFAN